MLERIDIRGRLTSFIISVVTVCLLMQTSITRLLLQCLMVGVCADEYMHIVNSPIQFIDEKLKKDAVRGPQRPFAISPRNFSTYLFIFLSLGILLVPYSFNNVWAIYSSTAIAIMIVFFSALISASSSSEPLSPHHWLTICTQVFGIIYIPQLFAHATLLNFNIYAIRLISFPIVVTATGENGGLLIGAMLGTWRPLPNLSPKKSIEGFIAQIIFSILAVIVCDLFLGFHVFGFSFRDQVRSVSLDDLYIQYILSNIAVARIDL
jgi:CDP-diglyceride synthetase